MFNLLELVKNKGKNVSKCVCIGRRLGAAAFDNSKIGRFCFFNFGIIWKPYNKHKRSEIYTIDTYICEWVDFFALHLSKTPSSVSLSRIPFFRTGRRER